jgi:hypothetical protein
MDQNKTLEDELNPRKRKMASRDESGSFKKSKPIDPVPDTLVRCEIFRKNDKPFDGRLSREDITKVWVESLRQDFSFLDGFASIQIRGRSLRINFRLKKAVVVSDLFKKPDFEWERYISSTGSFDWYSGRILGLSSTSAAIGDTVTVCVNRTALEFTDKQIESWLENYGSIEGNFNYLKDKQGLKTDDIEVPLFFLFIIRLF